MENDNERLATVEQWIKDHLLTCEAEGKANREAHKMILDALIRLDRRLWWVLGLVAVAGIGALFR